MAVRRKKNKGKKSPGSYQKRTYREMIDKGGLVSCVVLVRETDLHILATRDVEQQAYELVYQYRNQLENYIVGQPDFLSSLVPLPVDSLAPPIVRAMLAAGQAAGVGPMAAVAGTVAEFVGRDLLAAGVSEVMVENGGDIFLNRRQEALVAIFAGQSPLSRKLGLRIASDQMPLGICTSSGTVGHSLSKGTADAVTVLAVSTPLADAVATRLGNEIADLKDLDQALEVATTIPGITGVVMVKENKLGAWGRLELVKVS